MKRTMCRVLVLTSLVGCNALVELAAELTEVQPNSVVPALLLEAV